MYLQNIYCNKMNNGEIQGLANRKINPIGVIEMLAVILKTTSAHGFRELFDKMLGY